MDLSYQEKSILGSLIAMIVVYGYYFARVLRDADQREFSLGRLILAGIAIIVIEIVYRIVLALESKTEPKDERDILIESKAYRNAYFWLSCGAFSVIIRATSGNLTPFLVANQVLFFMVLAEIVKFFTQLFYYRRGMR